MYQHERIFDRVKAHPLVKSHYYRVGFVRLRPPDYLTCTFVAKFRYYNGYVYKTSTGVLFVSKFPIPRGAPSPTTFKYKALS